MINPLGGVCPIAVGEHCIDSQVTLYVFNFMMPLQHIFPHNNLELQPRADVKL
jgi:hypothetical protein